MKKINVAIIPARSGSKRIKNKYIKIFFNKPMIYWTIKALKKLKYFNKIIVTSDSQKILLLSKKYGADILIKRPKKLSTSTAVMDDVIKHSLNLLNVKYEIDKICCVYPCNPLIQKKDLQLAMRVLKKNNDGFVFCVAEYKHPIQRAHTLNKNNNKLKIAGIKGYDRKLMTQDYENHFHDIGQFYLAKNKTWMKVQRDKYGIVIPSWRAIDIDDLDDWKHAELIFKSIKS